VQVLSIYMNQRASNGKSDFWQEQVDRHLFRSERFYRRPQNLTELQDQLKNDITNCVDALISVGGDGTVNTLIQSLAKTDIGLLVIPGGTANDLARELGTHTMPRKILECISNDDFQYIDLIRINNQLMATNGGFGLGCEVARKINEMRLRFPLFKEVMKMTGKRIYSLFIAKEILAMDFEPRAYYVECDQFNGTVSSSAFLINNQPMVAGSIQVAPGTSNCDGKFNVLISTHTKKQKLIRALISMAAGVFPKNDPELISFETQEIKVTPIDNECPLSFFGDGEIFPSQEGVFHIKIEPLALKVYRPNREKTLLSICNDVSLAQ
jgi:diacylglycerol kinase family enzyme